jgi:alkylated DNA repair dioxygenase AlkB
MFNEILQKTTDLELEEAFSVRGIPSYTPQQILHLKTGGRKITVYYDEVLSDEIIKRGFVPRRIIRNQIYNRLLSVGTSSRIYLDIFSNFSYEQIEQSYAWHQMYHKGSPVPRLISIQTAEYNDGRIPIYRHPAESVPTSEPFNILTGEIANRLFLIFQQRFNHVLVQKYRNGDDYIREHTDKTLDIKTGTPIINVSFGCNRRMFLKSKTTHQKESFYLTHGSVFCMSYDDNRAYLHGINRDKSLGDDERISLTFRVIDTFLTTDGVLVGKGAPQTEKQDDSEAMIRAFSEENHSPTFNEGKWYGNGFHTICLSS